MGIYEGLEGKLSSIYWPGSEQTIPKGWTLAENILTQKHLLNEKANCYACVEFSQPYIKSQLVMVVAVKPGVKDKGFFIIDVFKKEMWIQITTMSISSAVAIWLTECANKQP
ncbi:unnamed protein product [Fraxinus pennsylvanica]|uniref:Uncharacterized protein n=1 Tax=Fraxinus pennsylvanica TaxID=56036 RepID=A0AAD1YRC6_9LAMI|nr:unnamed protein product [Fraxinus pennsylvanica]